MDVFVKGYATITRLMILVAFTRTDVDPTIFGADKALTSNAVTEEQLAKLVLSTASTCYQAYVDFINGNKSKKVDSINTIASTQVDEYFKELKTPECIEESKLIPKGTQNDPAHPKSYHSVYKCYSLDMIFQLFISDITRTVVEYQKSHKIEASSLGHQEAWHLMLEHIYPYYIWPLFGTLDSMMKQAADSNMSSFLTWSTIIILSVIILNTILIISLVKLEHSIKSIIKVLLSISAVELAKSDDIMNLFNGIFKSKHSHNNDLENALYDECVERIHSPTFIIDKHSQILYRNSYAKLLFDEGFDEIPSRWAAHKECILIEIYDPEEQEESTNRKKISRNYKVDIRALGQETALIELIDIDENVKLDAEIQQEKREFSLLLQKVIPKQTLQLAEENKAVVFLVPSITSVAINLKDFGEANVEEEMNCFFEFCSDKMKLSNFSSASVIEIIGKTVLIIAGVFDEVNQESKHARETAEFALNAIQYLNSKKIIASLGLATGGPIVCGFIELERPIFEIVGDTVNLSIEIAKTGLPGELQVTRNVYELIYGGKFAVRERGEVEVSKYGKMITYLVKLQ